MCLPACLVAAHAPVPGLQGRSQQRCWPASTQHRLADMRVKLCVLRMQAAYLCMERQHLRRCDGMCLQEDDKEKILSDDVLRWHLSSGACSAKIPS